MHDQTAILTNRSHLPFRFEAISFNPEPGQAVVRLARTANANTRGQSSFPDNDMVTMSTIVSIVRHKESDIKNQT
jgi:hypothetical protein